MAKAQDTCEEINAITAILIEHGLCDSQKFARLKQISGTVKEVSCDVSENFSLVLRNISYRDMYDEIKRYQDYNVAMVDGALVQLQSLFDGEDLVKHRLAFLPSPNLTIYQNDPDIYEADEGRLNMLRYAKPPCSKKTSGKPAREISSAAGICSQ